MFSELSRASECLDCTDMTLLRGVVTGLAVLLLMTACSGSEADEPGSAVAREAELASVTRERDRLQQDVRRVETELASVSAERDELRTGLDAAGAKRDRLQQDVRVLKEELAHVSAERDELDRRLASVSAKREELEGSLASVSAKREELEGSLASVSSERDGLGLRLAAVEAERDELLAQRREQDVRITDLESELQRTSALSQEAQEQVQYLLSKYDEEIRADLQAAIDGEIDRACAVASAPETYEMPVADIVSWQPDWEPITTRTQLERAVERCASPERERLAEQRRAELSTAVDAEIERACAAAIENYNEPIGSFPRWEPEWESVISRLQQIEAVEECAKPERIRRITAEIQSAVDAEIERACAAAIDRYHQSVGSIVRWHYTWASILTQPELIEAVEECAGPERSRLISEELQAAVDAEMERACAIAVAQYDRPVSEIVQWKTDWEAVTTLRELEQAAEECAGPERARLVRAELETAVDAEIKRACAIAVERFDRSVSSIVRWDPEWGAVTTQTRLETAVRGCAESERKRLIEQHRARRSVPVRDGKFEFSITGVERPGRKYSSGSFTDEAVGTWFVVHLTVTNIGDVHKTFSSDDQDLIWGSRRYAAEGFTWSADNHIELNPGLKIETTILFDVPDNFPEEGFGTLLELHDSFLSGGVKVQL